MFTSTYGSVGFIVSLIQDPPSHCYSRLFQVILGSTGLLFRLVGRVFRSEGLPTGIFGSFCTFRLSSARPYLQFGARTSGSPNI